MAIDFSTVKVGDLLAVQPCDIPTKLFLERQGYTVGQTVQIVEISEPIVTFNPRIGGDETYLHIVVTNGKRPLDFGVRASEGYASIYFA